MDKKYPHLIPGRTRIRDADGFVATVLYVGPVASAKKSEEIYVGVDWDDDTRGKHDGTVICRRTNQIVRHFTSKSLCGGSFLRMSKVDLGVGLDLKLMKIRYVGLDAELVAPNNILPFTARTSSGREKPIEFLGELNVRNRQQLEDLEDISLRIMGISHIVSESSEEMSKMFGHVKELDLAGNLLSDWNTIFNILRIFPLMEVASFSTNRIQDIPINPTSLESGEFPLIRVLNFNKCSIGSFQTLLALDRLCPNLEELCVGYGNLSDISEFQPFQRDTDGNEEDKSSTSSEPDTRFSKLKLLDCTACNLTSWDDQVIQMSSFPSLENLILNDNPLSHVTLSSPSNAGNDFPNLIQLQIGGTAVESWSGIENVAFLTTLKSFNFRNTPLTATIGTGETRANVIARLPQIDHLNASMVTVKERIEAERRYVTNVSREFLLLTAQGQHREPNVGSGTGDDGDIELDAELAENKLRLFQKYPRFREFMVKHKEAMITAQSSTLSGGTISQSAVNVTIRSMAADSCTREPLHKRLPGNLKVGRLKIMCARGFGLNVELQRLHLSNDGDPFPAELGDDENTLAYYAVNDGAVILMNEIDLEAEKKEGIRRAELQNRRIEEQEKSSTALQAMQKNDMKAHSAAAEKAADRLMQ